MDFPPNLKFTDNTGIEHVPDMKLVGVILSENLSWYKNIFVEKPDKNYGFSEGC